MIVREAKETINGRAIPIYRINNDIDGNPRYVIHFIDIANTYKEALGISRGIGGKVYRAKWFGGGIVFKSYNLRDDLSMIVR